MLKSRSPRRRKLLSDKIHSLNASSQKEVNSGSEETPIADQSSKSVASGAADRYVSPWLYLGGLSVTLSGLYAINFVMGDPNFALLTYALAAFGYLLSFTLRSYRVSLRALRIPLVICLGLMIIAWLSNDPSLRWLGPSGEGGDRGRDLQLFFLWLGIVHSFTLTNDATVLFSCVPCMTMIALVSTGNTEVEVQNSFLWFSGSATFLLIHENFLRTHAGSTQIRSGYRSKPMFQMQLIMAGLCIAVSFALANFVAIPLHSIGGIIPLGRASLAQTSTPGKISAPSLAQFFDSSTSISIASGPQSESATPVMSVKESQPHWLQGTTYDTYTGRSFENHLKAELRPFVTTEVVPDTPSPNGAKTVFAYRFAESAYNETLDKIKSKELVRQEVTILSGGLSQYFAAGTVRLLSLPKKSDIDADSSGTVQSKEQLQATSEYSTQSYVSTATPDELRKAPIDLYEYPQSVQQAYLQVSVDGNKNAVSSDLAEKLTASANNHYDKVILLKEFIEKNCKYNLQAKAAPSNMDRVEYFLTSGHEGYCDSFAAGLTMLCRYVGIPARMASGYLVQTANKTQDGEGYVVQQKDKHVWTEVFFNNYGWIKFDATEGAQDISDHDVSKKSGNAKNTFLIWLFSSGWLPIGMGLCILALVSYLIKTEIWDRRRARIESQSHDGLPETNRQIVHDYLEITKAFGRRGIARTPEMTAEEFASHVQSKLPAHPEAVTLLASMTGKHGRFRYGSQAATPADASESRSELKQLSDCLKAIPAASFKSAKPV